MPTVVTGNKVPLYRQVATRVMQKIRSGDYQPGEPLPSIRSISDEYNTSLNVAQRAIRELEKKGIVTAHHGKQVTVMQTAAAERAALVFGLIQPYGNSMAFGRDVLELTSRAFSDRNNLMVAVASECSVEREREQARHLIANGVCGLLVWPVGGDVNAEFFSQLSTQVPVILLDRLIGGNLPAIIHDTRAGGQDICEHFLRTLNRKRLLVLMDDLDITPYQDLLRGMRDTARELGRFADLTIVQLPISDLIQHLNSGDFSAVDHHAQHVDRLLREGGYDCLFCTQDEFIDYVLIETGVFARYPDLKLGTSRCDSINRRSRRFVEARPIIWQIEHQQAIAMAADRLQEWVLSKRPMNEVVQLKLTRHDPIENVSEVQLNSHYPIS